MQQKILDFIHNGGLGAVVAMVCAAMVSLNLVLTGVKSFLDYIKDKTETSWDNKASEYIGKLCYYLGVGIDWAQGNKAHPEVKAEEKKE